MFQKEVWLYVIAELGTPKKIPSQIKASKKMHGNFFHPKNPKITKSKISNPTKILRSSPSLEIRSILWAKAAKYLKKF